MAPASIPLADVEVADAMHPGVLSVADGTSPRRAASVMAASAIHAVVLAAPAPVIVTDLDVLAAALTDEPIAAASQRGAALPIVAAHEPLSAAAEAMARADVAHALVHDPDAALPIGVLSAFDVAAVVAGRPPRIARLVRPAPARPAPSEGRLERVSVESAMHPGVITVAPATPLAELAGVLADRRIHAVAVAGTQPGAAGDERLVWEIVSDMDVLRAAAAGARRHPRRARSRAPLP